MMDNQPRVQKNNYHLICAASATPPGQSGLAVLRMSGPGSIKAADEIFLAYGSQARLVSQMQGYTCAFGKISDPQTGQMIDQAVVTVFKAPHSYTGEDVVEISCHGGTAVKQAILDCLFRLGVSAAEPGEFTRRAFLNGKIDLVQAEAVMDLIQAGAKKSSLAAASQLQGALSGKMRQISQALYDIQAEIELVLEFPEHDEEEDPASGLEGRLSAVRETVERLSATFRQGRMLREGLTVVIAGRPNAGKSSLLNALAGYDRSIVTPVPGTTRDTVEEIIDMSGLPVRLVDTAGMRDTEDFVEQQGVDRARAALNQADLVFWLISPPLENLENEKKMIYEAGLEKPVLIIGKEDLEDSRTLYQTVSREFSEYKLMTFSALRPEGLDPIRQAISEHYEQSGSRYGDDLIITNSRHHALLLEAADVLREAERALNQHVPLDMVASLLRSGAEACASITGDQVSDKLVQTIFSRFCVGK